MTTTTSSPSTLIAVAKPAFTNPERLPLGGFLAGYSGLTREAYALDLRQHPVGASSIMYACSMPAGPTSSASPGKWEPTAALERA